MSRLPFALVAVLLALSVVSPAVFAQVEPVVLDGEATPVPNPISAVIGDLTDETPLPLDDERRAALAAFVDEAMTVCTVPGASVAVVQDGEVVFLEGFGVRELGRPDAVTPDTLMRVGSVTKPMTTTLAATLVDDGLVAWETPAIELLPDFTLSDPARAERLTLADLFSAATGLPRRDLEFIFESDEYTPAGLIAATARLPLTALPGERFQYSNQAFALGGYAAASAAGAAPGDLLGGYLAAMQHRVLNPVGMERSTFVLRDVLKSGDYAVPHAPDLSGTPRQIPLLMEDRFTTAVAPAGAMWSSARDLARFLQTQLAEGIAPDGSRVVSAENLRRTWQPGVEAPANPQLPPIISEGLAGYGLGWYIGGFGGLELISHSGGTFGFSSELAFLPEADLGIAVLANDPVCGALLAYAVQYRLFEIVYDLEPTVAGEFAAFAAAIAAQRAAARLMLDTVDAGAISTLLGWYAHPELGEIELRLVDGDLVVDAGEVRSRIAPLRGLPGAPVRYVALDPPLGGAPGWFTVETGPDGEPRLVLTATPEPGQEPQISVFTPVDHDRGPAAPPAA